MIVKGKPIRFIQCPVKRSVISSAASTVIRIYEFAAEIHYLRTSQTIDYIYSEDEGRPPTRWTTGDVAGDFILLEGVAEGSKHVSIG